jgi:uncharacterized protein (TIGR01319 family)
MGATLNGQTGFVVTDVGSTTTKAVYFRGSPEWRFFRAESPTTVEKPYEDVTVGVVRAFEELERQTGAKLLEDGRPAIPYFSTSSAGGGLAMVVTGLVHKITARSADRAALGAGAIVLDVLAMDDGRTPYRKIEDLKTLRPDMVLLAGGFDADNITGPAFLAELLIQADLHPKLNPEAKLPVIYAGNVNARDYVRSALDELFMFYPTANIQPSLDKENYGPARDAIHRLFMDHVMSRAPGYEKLTRWVAAPILPTPAAFARALSLVSQETRKPVLAVDIGGATTDVFTAEDGSVFRTVSANLGLSYSILNVCRLVGPERIIGWLGQEMGALELWDRIGNKLIHPTRLPADNLAMRVEWATATGAIREAVRAHYEVMRGADPPPGLKGPRDVTDLLKGRTKRAPAKAPRPPEEFELIVGSGGILSHSPHEAAARVLVDALQPGRDAELTLDNEFIFPHIGAIAEQNPALALELLGKLGMVKVGKAGSRVFAYPADYAPAASAEAAEASPVRRGPLRMTRALVIPGTVFVKVGDKVEAGTPVARSTRQFLRPFFLHAAEALQVPPKELHVHLRKRIGDQVEAEDIIASRPRRIGGEKVFRSPVAGRLEKILPAGVLLVREKPEHAQELTAVAAARDLGIEPRQLKRYLRVRPGDPVERGQWLAALMRPGSPVFSASPVRGKVDRIDLEIGMVVLAPLLDELEVKAWLPGTVVETTDRGCTIEATGTTLTGVWGTGSESSGPLELVAPAGGCVFATDFAGSKLVAGLHKVGAAGLVCAGVNLADVLDPVPEFPLVVLEGFGEQRLAPDALAALRGHAGRRCLLDGTTRLRVGVRRPFVILPD